MSPADTPATEVCPVGNSNCCAAGNRRGNGFLMLKTALARARKACDAKGDEWQKIFGFEIPKYT